MRPLELSLEGFTSFRHQSKINFENLELFAITGQTGAGKSSLLDAMTLALYGKVARFTGKTQPKELLSQGSVKLQVSLRFLVDGIEYQVLRSWLYRAKTAQTFFKLQKLINGNWENLGEQKEAEINAAIEKILQMNFETFTKVILLPQGQFDKFLKGEASKRREILRQLTGYQIFADMRSQAEKQANILEGECNSLQQQLNGLELPSDIELNSRRERYKLIAKELPRLNQEIENAKAVLETEKKLLQRLEDLANRQQKLEQLHQYIPEINRIKHQLETARICDRLSAIWTSVNSARSRYYKTQVAAENAAEDLIKKQSALQIQADNLQAVKAYQAEIAPQLKQREQALNDAKIYEQQRREINQEVKRLENILVEKTKLINEVEKSVKQAETELQSKNKILVTANNQLAEYSPGGLRLEQLNQVIPLLIKWEQIDKQVGSERSKLEKITQDLKTAEDDCQTTNLILQDAKAELLKARAELNTARQQNHAAAIRALLHTGDECLVCGGVYPEVHLLPQIESSLDIKALEKYEIAADKKHQKAANAKIQSETTRDNLKKQEVETLQELSDKENELAAETKKIVAILKTDTWEVKLIQNEHKILQAKDAKYQECLEQKNKADTEVKSSEQNLKFAKDKLSYTQTQYQDAATEVERQKTKLLEISNTVFQLTGGESYENLWQKLEKDQQDLENRLQQVNASYKTANDEFIQAQQNEAKAREYFDLAATEKSQIETNWQNSLLSENLTEVVFEESKTSPEMQDKLQQQITEHDTEKLRLETLIQQDKKEIGDQTITPEIIHQHGETIIQADTKLQETQAEYNDLKFWITQVEQQRKQLQQFQLQLANKQKELETYRILSKELKSDRFQAYILQHFEQELVEQATVFLRELTEQRYALKYDDKEYYVEDNWSGGETRRVQTLSGGETFATSLSLALALSEKLSRGAKLGSLFIDEGFGTLDAETLQSVSSILQSLGQQDKLVGVITHVPALGEELGTQIKVEKFPEGSRIIMA
ncbi:SMC family ATPase [Anabaena sphaerica FACHB-251]|uniref:Nuclease SbcCD subunit C n=1 Tax=Anabaena sphaerica FACHB-251 TaxID=2692883 RepID=A0A927A3K9_9NOST|nr:SMC family ATPase [Anabaena sphaerica]MBD2296824.1 SMC family ATPase [Anabaena sphaerica FACHB-251]